MTHQSKTSHLIPVQPRTPQEKPINVAVESASLGHSTVKPFKGAGGNAAQPEEELVTELEAAQATAKAAGLGLWSGAGLVRQQKQAGEQFNVSELVAWSGGRQIPVMIEHCFDGTRYRCSVLEDGPYAHSSFTLQLAGVQSPRVADAYGGHAKHFVDLRILNRQLSVTFVGSLPSASQPPAVAVLHHPRGNIGVELLKAGLAMVSERTARMLGPTDVVSYRQAEAAAKGQKVNMWRTYVKPTIEGVAETNGSVVEVVTGDTLLILPTGVKYDGDSKLLKVSLASIRSPRLGNERTRKPDEPYAYECKDRLRQMVVGKQCKVTVDYEREIPYGPAGPDGTQKAEKRKFATVLVGNRGDVGEVLVSEVREATS